MQVNIIKNEGLDRHYRVVVNAQEIKNKISASLNDIAKTYKMPGFRPGKVPIDLIKQKHGQALHLEVIEKQINETISQIVKENKLELATSPKLEDVKQEVGEDLEFTLQFELIPEVTLPDFKKIKIEKLTPAVTEKDIDEQLVKLTERFKEFKKASSKTKAKKGDQLLISFEGFIDGVAFQGGKAEDYALELGSGSFIEGFEDQLIGSKEGDEKTVKVKFPENYGSKEFAGKDAEFVVIVKEVRQAEIPEVNEDFLKKLNVESIDKLRSRLEEEVKKEYEESIRTIMKVKLFDELEDKLTFPAPGSLVEREFKILWNQLQEIKEFDETVKKKDEKQLENYYKKVATRRVKIGLMLAEFAKHKDIKITNEDLTNAIYQQARAFPGNPKVVFDYYQKNPKALESLTGPILEDKAVTQIFENEVELKVKEYKLSALDKIIDEENSKEVV
ncbi:MAG: tig [Rickettsiaceae bacterium]|jgi:trigger factor|nr:tig [Rickettsiaceae bacterium]